MRARAGRESAFRMRARESAFRLESERAPLVDVERERARLSWSSLRKRLSFTVKERERLSWTSLRERESAFRGR